MQGGDHEFMIPIGGRIYIPQPFKRLEFSVGGGTAYLHYSETVSSGHSGLFRQVAIPVLRAADGVDMDWRTPVTISTAIGCFTSGPRSSSSTPPPTVQRLAMYRH